MRKIIAALQTSVDGFIEGSNRELDWAMAEDEETWRDLFEFLGNVDTCILGAHHTRTTSSTGWRSWSTPKDRCRSAVPPRRTVAYAWFADRTPHVVVSRTLDRVEWKTTRIVRDLDEIEG